MVSASMPVSDASTSAAAAEGRHRTRAAVGSELFDRGGEGGGLAGAGRADDEDEVGVTGDRCRGLGLGPGEFDPGPVDGVGGVDAVSGHAALGPGEEAFFLGEDVGVVRARSAIDSVIGRPSRRRVAPSGMGREMSTQRLLMA